jgi:hypothetical protein
VGAAAVSVGAIASASSNWPTLVCPPCGGKPGGSDRRGSSSAKPLSRLPEVSGLPGAGSSAANEWEPPAYVCSPLIGDNRPAADHDRKTMLLKELRQASRVAGGVGEGRQTKVAYGATEVGARANLQRQASCLGRRLHQSEHDDTDSSAQKHDGPPHHATSALATDTTPIVAQA